MKESRANDVSEHPTHDGPTTKIDFPSRIREATRVLERIQDELSGRCFAEKTIFAIRLALDEAISNAIRHGNEGEPSRRVTIQYRITHDGFEGSVADEGPGFEPHAIPDPTQDEYLERPTGRGLMLMHAYMTTVRFNPRGNQVTLYKHRACCSPLIAHRPPESDASP